MKDERLNQVYIAWVPFQRRAISIQSYFNYDLRFITLSFSKKYLRPFEYLIKIWQTLLLLLQARPSVVWVQLPPTLLLHLLFFYKIIFDHHCTIIADCHNATFRSPWVQIPGFRALLRHCDLVIVHNDDVKNQIENLAVPEKNLLILEDPPAFLENKSVFSTSSSLDRPWVLCPCSFNQDEPIANILDAARLIPKVTFVLTGNKHRAMKNHNVDNLPINVILPGFLPSDEFDHLLHETDVVIGLTLLDGIQLSVANEAVGVGKPLVLANTPTLCKLFYKGAIYVDPHNSASISSGCLDAIRRQVELTQEINELRSERQEIWLKQAHLIKDVLNGV